VIAHRGVRRGFTLVELLVVIAIIGILIALLLPAVQAAREAARRISCTNNAKQLALALHNYHQLNKMFPINWGDSRSLNAGTQIESNNDQYNGHSWLTAILPYVEEEALYDTIECGQPIGWTNSASVQPNKLALQRQIATFRCPSDIPKGTMPQAMYNGALDVGVTNYKACAGSNWEHSPNRTRKQDRGYKGRNANQYNGLDKGDGIICRGAANNANGNPTVTAIRDIRDGTVHTFALGEAVPKWCNWSAWYWWNGSTATCAIPLNYEVAGTSPRNNAGDWQNNYSFMSRHSGGANFGMCDGSVRFISEEIDTATYLGLATIDGKEILGEY